MFVENLFDGRGRRVIEEYDDLASERAQQLTPEHTHLVLLLNDGNVVLPSRAMTMDGRLSLRSLGSHHVGNQQDARFIGKDDLGV